MKTNYRVRNRLMQGMAYTTNRPNLATVLSIFRAYALKHGFCLDKGEVLIGDDFIQVVFSRSLSRGWFKMHVCKVTSELCPPAKGYTQDWWSTFVVNHIYIRPLRSK
jgi:hypothetical protein